MRRCAITDLAKLVVRLEAETAKYQANLDKATARLQKFEKGVDGSLKRVGSAFRTLGGFIGISFGVSMFAGAIKEAANFGDEIQKAADAAGTSASVFSELAAAAKQVDVEIGTLSLGFKGIQTKISEAAAGSKSAARTFAELGISLEDIRRRKPEDQLGLIAGQIAKISDPTDRARIGTDLFGRAYLALIPLLKEGEAGLRRLREEQVRLGNTYSDAELAKLAKLDDKIKGLTASWKSMSRTLVGAVAPALSGFFGILERGITVQEESLDSLRSRLASIESGFDEKEKQDLRDQIALLERRNILRDTLPIGSQGQQQKKFRFTDVGIDPALVAKQAEAAAKAAAEAEEHRFDTYLAGISRQLEAEEDFAERRESLQEGFVKDNEAAMEQVLDDAAFAIDDWAKEYEKSLDKMNVYADQAARNMQDAFADFLFDPFEDGIKGMLKGFIGIIRRMVAETAAAKIFGSKDSGGLGLGDLIATGVGALIGGDGLSPVTVTARHMATGTNFVPNDSLAFLHKGEAVVPAKYNPSAGGVGRGMVITIHNDNRGATHDLIRALPEHDRRLAEQIEARIVEGLQRRRYDLG